MTKPISRRFILNPSLVLSLLLVIAGWVVTKTAANSKMIARKSPTLGIALKNPRARQPKFLLTARPVFQQPAQGEKTIEQTRKNIKVLNGIPESQLIPMMNFFAASLGVRCNFCHVNNAGQWDYPADTKPEKNTARELITMTLSVNKTTKGTNGEVSCFSCHRDRTTPVRVPALPLPQPT